MLKRSSPLKNVSNSPAKRLAVNSHGSPVRAAAVAAAPAMPENDDERYLYAVLALSCPDQAMRDDLWHILTCAPLNYVARCEDLEKKLAALEALYFASGNPNKNFKVLVEDRKVFNCMLGITSVYYAATERATEEMDFFALNIAQLIIYEKITGIAIGGKSHLKKGMQVRSAIEETIDRLGRASAHLTHKKAAATGVQKTIAQFIAYLKLHRECLTIAIEYDDASQRKHLNTDLMPHRISDFVAGWHPGAMKHLTPKPKATAAAKKLRQLYRSSTGKSSPSPRKRSAAAMAAPRSPARPILYGAAHNGSPRGAKSPKLISSASAAPATPVRRSGYNLRSEQTPVTSLVAQIEALATRESNVTPPRRSGAHRKLF